MASHASPASPPATSSSAALHLVLPGLLWPQQALQDLVFDLPLPALSWLLGRGKLQRQPYGNSQSWLAHTLQLPSLPAAALRQQTISASNSANWLCLDPINLRIERTQLIVEDPATLQLTEAEAQTFIADLAPLLAELGELQQCTPHAWNLRLHDSTPILTTPLADAIGLNGEQLMPQCANVKIWRRVLNEVQMTLHTHPLNAARSSRGLPAVNSLWPWGEGSFESELEAAPHRHWQCLQANDPMLQGLAQHLACTGQALPQRFEVSSANTWVLQDSLATATQARDAMKWRNALVELEQHWFAPLQQALQAGALKQLVIHGSGAGQALQLTLGSTARWQFWRKPAPLTLMGVANATA